MPRKAKPRKPKKSRRDPLSGDPTDILREQREAFRKKFGRDPGPNDPIFFDPEADLSVELKRRFNRIQFC